MSKEFERMSAYLATQNKSYTSVMQLVPTTGLAILRAPRGWLASWRSNRFLAQVYAKEDGVQRITVNRSQIDTGTGRWLEGITWIELQKIKSEIGFGDMDAVEVYPPDQDIVNDAPMRHLFVMDQPLRFTWRTDARMAELFGAVE